MGFAEYADFGAPLWTYRIRIWGGAMDLLVASVPNAPDTHKSLEPSSWSVDQGRAWESARRVGAETGGVEGPRRTGKTWKSRSVEVGQGGPGTDLFLHQDCLRALPQEFQPCVPVAPPVACGTIPESPNPFAKEALSGQG